MPSLYWSTVCFCASLSYRDPGPLPGERSLGERLHYIGMSETYRNGDKLIHGQQGEVMGPALSEELRGIGLNMKFAGNSENIECQYKSHQLLLLLLLLLPLLDHY